MKKLRYYPRFFICLLACIALFAQRSSAAGTTLSRGDIAIISICGITGGTHFSFVTWVDLAPGTVINFTTNPFQGTASANAANNAAGSTSIVRWTNTEGSSIPAGTVISLYRGSGEGGTDVCTRGSQAFVPSSDNVGSPGNSLLNLGTSGKAVFAYQGSDYSSNTASATTTTTFNGSILFGICYQGTGTVPQGSNAWLSAGAVNNFKSYLPSELAASSSYHINNLGVKTVDGQYTGPRTGAATMAAYQAMVTDPANWTVTSVNGTAAAVDYTAFTVPSSNVAPTFTGGSPQSLTVCQNASATSINSYLTVNDADAGQTETWTVAGGGSPSHGSIVTGTTHASGTGVSPTGFTYQPTAGYSGSDAFTIQVSDGNGGTASTTINVTITASPTAGAGSALAAICQGATTAALGGSFGGSATSAVWSDGGAGGSFANNGGSTPNTATYTASASSATSVTLTLNTSGGSCGTASANKSLTVNQSRIVNAGGAVSAICQGATTAALGGSFGGSATSAVWSDGGAGGSFTGNGGSDPTNATYTASASSAASVTLTLTASGGSCGPTTATKSLTVNQSRIVNAGSAISAICQGATTAALGGSFGGSATSAVWSDGGAGGSFSGNGGSDPGTATYTASASSAASVTLTLTASGGSCGPTTATKSLTVDPVRIINAGGAVSAICQGGTTAALGGSFGGGATSAVWSDGGAGGSFSGNGGSDPTNATYTASASSPSSVTLTLTAGGGSCGPTTATKSLTVNQSRIVNAGSAVSAICQGGTTAALGGSFGGSATSAVWSDGGAGGSFSGNGGSDPANATYTASASAPSSVTLTLTASGGSCGPTTATKSLTVDPPRIVNAGSAVSAICQGGTTAALGGSFGGGATSAVWSDGGAGGSFSGNGGSDPANATYTASASSASSVTLTLTAGGGSCGPTTATKSLTVNQNRIVNAGGAISAICQGGTTTALGGSFGGSATSAVWSDGGAGGSFTGNSGSDPGNATYTASASSPSSVTLTLTASGGSCGPTTATKSITVDLPPLVAAGSAVSAICQNGTTAALGGSFGGNATSAVWSDGGAGGSFSGNGGSDPANATYTASASSASSVTLTLTASGGACASTTDSKSLTVNPLPTVNAGSALSAICQGGTTTALGGSFGGGATAGVWSDNGAGGSFTGNSGSTPGAVTYTASSSSLPTVTLTLTTSGGSCGTLSASKPLTVNPNPTVNVGSAVADICQGGTTAALGGSFGGGATAALWSDGAAGGSFTSNDGSAPGSVTYTASSSSVSTVTLTLTTSGGSCGTTSASKSLTVNANPTANVGGAISPICQGGTTTVLGGSIGGSATSGVWSDGGAGGTFANNGGSTPGTATYTASASSSTPVTLTLTTSGGLCGVVSPGKQLTVNPAPVIGSVSNDGPVCAGLTLGLSSTASGGTGALSYTWIGPGGYASTMQSLDIASVPTTAGGTYTLTVTDVNSCSATGTTVAAIKPTPAITIISNNAPVCEEYILTLSSTVTGGTGIYGYQWDGPNSFSSTDEDPTVMASATTAANGVYTLIVTDANGCVATGANTTSVTVYAIQPIIGPVSVLFGQTVTLSDPVTGGTWSTPTPWITSVTGSGGVVKGISAGTSVITYTSAQGCTATHTISVISGVNACVGQTITLSDNGVPGGTWSSGTASIATITPTTGVLTGVGVGKVVITYRTSPTAAMTTTVTVNPLLPTSMSAGMICQGQAITLTNTTSGGGTWYSGNTSIAVVSSTGSVSGLGGGVVNIYFTPVAGCVTVKTVTITAVSPIVGPPNVCVSSTITLSNSTPGGTWYSSNAALATATVGGGVVYGVAQGKPTIFYVWPNGCWASTTVTVNPLVQTTTSTTGIVCQGISIVYSNTTLGGGVWTTGNTNVATVNSAGLATGAGMGTTNVIFTTPAGCVATKSITVNSSPTISGNTSTCMGQTTTLSSSATSGTWSSSNASQASVSASGVVKGVSAGSPKIVYLMPTGCNSSVTVTVNTLNATTGGTAGMCQSGTMALTNTTPFGGAWTSSNTSVATVNSSGVVRGAGVGTVSILFTSAVGSCVATRTVTVNACRESGTTSVTETAEAVDNLQLFPNPNDGVFRLKGVLAINENEEVAIDVVNMTGQIVYRDHLKAHDGSIDERIDMGNNLADGTYLLRIRTGNNNKVFHFVVRHQ